MVGNGRIKFTPQFLMLSPFAHALMQSLITVCRFYFVLEGHKSSGTTCDERMKHSSVLLKIHVPSLLG